MSKSPAQTSTMTWVMRKKLRSHHDAPKDMWLVCLCWYILSYRQWCWWWQPIGKSPGWAWQGPRWCQSPRVCPLRKHTLVSVKASMMSEHCCVTLVAALLESNRLWNYLIIGTQSTWRNHTCWLTLTLTLDSVNGKHARTHMLPLLCDILANDRFDQFVQTVLSWYPTLQTVTHR